MDAEFWKGNLSATMRKIKIYSSLQVQLLGRINIKCCFIGMLHQDIANMDSSDNGTYWKLKKTEGTFNHM